MSNYFNMCQKNVGKPVKITTKDGRVHRGIIQRVNHSHVFLQPTPRGLGGYGFGYWGPYGYGPGFGVGVAFGAIATLAFLPFFFW
ncbi:hypothetical protein [Aquibacillus albus]|uniref:DUF2642 domain-containing protein n=1 Tax=Aquibacillus albus TaxID=1168171 RepID=A0ABS2N3E9_9BACI|nr:hypothetical protein [Aquibacillus albus]MBM7572624.1 hypothetical protein [Aquibacillus albus]